MKIKCRVCFLIAALFIIVTAILVLTNFAVIKSSEKHILSEVSESDYDCIIVLGAGVINGRPSDILKDRLVTGIELYNMGASGKILMSGDHGRKEYDEVNLMKRYAVERGVPSEDVFMDHAGFSTYETMYRARNVFKANKVLIVTQRFHLYRALYIADSLGIDADGVAADKRRYMYAARNSIREVLARTKDFFCIMVDIKPTYLGEAVPVSGNGDLTND